MRERERERESECACVGFWVLCSTVISLHLALADITEKGNKLLWIGFVLCENPDQGDWLLLICFLLADILRPCIIFVSMSVHWELG